MPSQQQVKKKKHKEGEPKKAFDIRSIPAPHRIKAKLDDYVIGQEHAKKVISVAVYNHYKRVGADTSDGVEIEKSNMLMLGAEPEAERRILLRHLQGFWMCRLRSRCRPL